ncbi:cell wall protein [Nocardiopsis oceani]
MHTADSLRGPLPPLAAVAAATVLVATAPAAAFADGETTHPRTTTVNRTDGLDPEGDTVTVSGIGHAPGTRIEITTRALPHATAGTEDADEAAVLDDDNAVSTDVDATGRFTVELDTGADFAADAGLDPAEDPFEIVLLDSEGAEEPADEPTRSPWPAEDEDGGEGGDSEGHDDGPASSEGSEDPGSPDESGSDRSDAAVASSPGPGMSAPVTAPAAHRTAPVVGAVPVSFAAPAADTPQSLPQPQAQPQAQTPQTTPRTTGEQELSVSKTGGIDPDGETLTVTGTGYDTAKGIYVALCDTASASSSQAPGPCIGGVDMEGEGGASVWVSSNPPPYGEGLTTPYTGSGTNGGFTVELSVQAADDSTDCLSDTTECAVVSRNDHTRFSDRGQDVFVPVTFAGQAGDQDDQGDSDGSDSSGDPDGSGSGSGSETGSGDGSSGGSGADGSGGAGGGGGNGPLATTGTALTGLVLAALVAALTGLTALLATRRRTTSDAHPA